MPGGGFITYLEGKVRCSVHLMEQKVDESENEVPFL
jgi:hypothetical protein